MSKRKSEEEYKKTFSYKFFKWFKHEDDPYIGRVEMSVKKPHEEEAAILRERMAEKEVLFDRIYDVEHNKLILRFRKIYKVIAVLFCIMLFMLLIGACTHHQNHRHAPDRERFLAASHRRSLKPCG